VLKIEAPEDCKTRAQAQKLIEDEVEAFDRSFTALGNAPLVRSEKALIRTYLLARLKGLVASLPTD